MTGEWPEGVVEHINRVRTDNRWANLRPQLNRLNRAEYRNNTSGVKGVSWSKHRRKWIAEIGAKVKREAFSKFEDAVRTRKLWEAETLHCPTE
jgi:hypothetical protein